MHWILWRLSHRKLLTAQRVCWQLDSGPLEEKCMLLITKHLSNPKMIIFLHFLKKVRICLHVCM